MRAGEIFSNLLQFHMGARQSASHSPEEQFAKEKQELEEHFARKEQKLLRRVRLQRERKLRMELEKRTILDKT